MSGFAETEEDIVIEETYSAETGDGFGALDIHGRSVPINTNFTPVKEMTVERNLTPISGTTSPAFSHDAVERRGSTRRTSLTAGGPSEDLMRTTAARVNDSSALEESRKVHRPSYLAVQEMPENHPLLRTTRAREVETQVREELRQLRESSGRQFRIADEDYQVKSSLLRKTQAQKNYEKAREEKQRDREEGPQPTFRIAPADFQISERLMRLTKERESDRMALEAEKAVPVPQKKPSTKKYTPPEHLVKPTQSFIAATNQWEDEKVQKRNAKDIWWEERRPAEKARSRPNTPSKLRSPTKSFLSSQREKVSIVLSNFASPEEALAAAAAAVTSVTAKPVQISEESHLLKPTRTSRMNHVDADVAVVAPEYIAPTHGLELVSKQSFRQPVDSKLHHFTVAAKAARYGMSIDDLQMELASTQRPNGMTYSPPGSPDSQQQSQQKMLVRAPSERVIALNSLAQKRVRSRHEVRHDPREEGWNNHTKKEHSSSVKHSSHHHHQPSSSSNSNRRSMGGGGGALTKNSSYSTVQAEPAGGPGGAQSLEMFLALNGLTVASPAPGTPAPPASSNTDTGAASPPVSSPTQGTSPQNNTSSNNNNNRTPKTAAAKMALRLPGSTPNGQSNDASNNSKGKNKKQQQSNNNNSNTVDQIVQKAVQSVQQQQQQQQQLPQTPQRKTSSSSLTAAANAAVVLPPPAPVDGDEEVVVVAEAVEVEEEQENRAPATSTTSAAAVVVTVVGDEVSALDDRNGLEQVEKAQAVAAVPHD